MWRERCIKYIRTQLQDAEKAGTENGRFVECNVHAGTGETRNVR